MPAKPKQPGFKLKSLPLHKGYVKQQIDGRKLIVRKYVDFKGREYTIIKPVFYKQAGIKLAHLKIFEMTAPGGARLVRSAELENRPDKIRIRDIELPYVMDKEAHKGAGLFMMLFIEAIKASKGRKAIEIHTRYKNLAKYYAEFGFDFAPPQSSAAEKKANTSSKYIGIITKDRAKELYRALKKTMH